MTRIIAIAALLGAIGCGGTVDVLAIEVNGAKSNHAMSEAEALDLRQGKLWTGVGYIVQCGGMRYALSGEAVIFQATGLQGYCLAMSPAETVLAVSANQVYWDQSTAPGFTADNSIYGWEIKSRNDKWTRFALHDNSEGGGGMLEVFAAPGSRVTQAENSYPQASSLVLNLDPIPHP